MTTATTTTKAHLSVRYRFRVLSDGIGRYVKKKIYDESRFAIGLYVCMFLFIFICFNFFLYIFV